MTPDKSPTQTPVQAPAVGANGAAADADDKRISKPCFDAIVEHWFKARIDGPMQTLIHYDETVKQLVTLGGLLPVILVAAYQIAFRPTPRTPSLLDMLTQSPTKTPTFVEVLFLALFVVGFCTFIGCLIEACSKRLGMETPEKTRKVYKDSCEVYKLLEHAAEGSLSPKDVSLAVREWNEHIDDLINHKHRWVKWASITLTTSTVCLVLLLSATAMRLV